MHAKNAVISPNRHPVHRALLVFLPLAAVLFASCASVPRHEHTSYSSHSEDVYLNLQISRFKTWFAAEKVTRPLAEGLLNKAADFASAKGYVVKESGFTVASSEIGKTLLEQQPAKGLHLDEGPARELRLFLMPSNQNMTTLDGTKVNTFVSVGFGYRLLDHKTRRVISGPEFPFNLGGFREINRRTESAGKDSWRYSEQEEDFIYRVLAQLFLFVPSCQK